MSAENPAHLEPHAAQPDLGEEVIPENMFHEDSYEGARLLNAMHHRIRARRQMLAQLQGQEFNPDTPILLTKEEIVAADRELHIDCQHNDLAYGHIDFKKAERVADAIGALKIHEDPETKTVFYEYIEPPVDSE